MIKAGDTVWSVRFSFGKALISSAIVEKVTAKTIKLSGQSQPGFGYKHVLSHDEVFASKVAALEWLNEKLNEEIGHVMIKLDKLRDARAANVAAIIAEQAKEGGHAA